MSGEDRRPHEDDGIIGRACRDASLQRGQNRETARRLDHCCSNGLRCWAQGAQAFAVTSECKRAPSSSKHHQSAPTSHRQQPAATSSTKLHQAASIGSKPHPAATSSSQQQTAAASAESSSLQHHIYRYPLNLHHCILAHVLCSGDLFVIGVSGHGAA